MAGKDTTEYAERIGPCVDRGRAALEDGAIQPLPAPLDSRAVALEVSVTEPARSRPGSALAGRTSPVGSEEGS